MDDFVDEVVGALRALLGPVPPQRTKSTPLALVRRLLKRP
ncbi:MAG: hypothetical protein BWY91_02169 [bacterium ADurb.BinA028]|nr:MAG: hypothetical protein BWY91_02169 [bacterium ADurb.BinA028]